VEASQVKRVVGEGLTVVLNQERVVLLCQLPQNTAGNLHLPERMINSIFISLERLTLLINN